MRENPDGFPCAQAALRMGPTDCIASAASPQSLLPFRYIDGFVLGGAAPCRIVAPGIERLSQELAGQLKAVKVNTDEAPSLQERFGIRGIPTLILMDGGKERDRVTGAMNVNAMRQWAQQRLPARSK
jgi:thiol-disulfide isomerase/thioredoxin